MNESIETYWKKRFDESALNFENDADIGLWGKHGFDIIKIIPIYIFPKMLISFEKLFEKNGVFRALDKVHVASLLLAHSFMIERS